MAANDLAINGALSLYNFKKCLIIILTINYTSHPASQQQPAAASSQQVSGRILHHFSHHFSIKIDGEPKKHVFQNRKNKIVFSTKLLKNRMKKYKFFVVFFWKNVWRFLKDTQCSDWIWVENFNPDQIIFHHFWMKFHDFSWFFDEISWFFNKILRFF